MLIHAGDRTLLQQIRSELSPDTFVIGRLFVSLAEQTAWLTGSDPDGAGTAFADRIINYDFQLPSSEEATTGCSSMPDEPE